MLLRAALALLVASCAPTTGGPVGSAAPPSGPVQVVVVGGGLAGLVTAYELGKRGITAHVLEASDDVGGRVQTAYYDDGLAAEFGMQELWRGNPLIAIAEELGLALDRGAEAYSSMIIDGTLYPFVQDTGDLFLSSIFDASERARLNAWMQKAAHLLETARSSGLADPEVRRLQDLSFEQWIAAEKLPPKVATWLRLTIECELGAGWEKFSALFALLEFEIFLHGGVENYHVNGGNTRLIRALAAKSSITTGATVNRVRRWDEAGKTRVRVDYVHKNEVRSLEADRVVLAVPFVRLHQIQIEPPLPDEHWQALYTLSFGQYVVVHLLIDKAGRAVFPHPPEDLFAVLTGGPLGVIYGIQEPSPPSQPREVFSLLVYGENARAFHMAPRELKVKEALAELDALFPGLSSHVERAHVYSYHPAAIPVWPPGRSPLDEPSQLLRRPVQGLHLAGDWLYNAHSDGAARSAIDAAEQIARELRSGAR